ncbi:MAG: hypothetical protein C4523_16535 [Myxococcales bacterium]|nr:MAG: hypothetical protein C4523_16535 [Myxococcales bacterium]
MNRQPYPHYLFDPATTHLFALAHQDDEINYCGLIRRLGEGVDFVWLTNGDGLAPFENADPKQYAEMRKAEADQVLLTLGRPLKRRVCLDWSEIEIYDHFVELTLNPANRPAVMNYFHRLGDDVYRRIKAHKPHVVWTLQFQNGHPEHDLMHILTALAIRQLEREAGYRPAFYQLPEYEYTILVPLRFHPLYKGVVHELLLREEELEIKRRAFDCYPSQVKLFAQFQRVIDGLGKLARLVGKGFDAQSFLSHEQFGPVPERLDYARSVHVFEWANYMRDKHKNVKVRFDRHLAEIYKALSERPFEG